MNEAPKSPTGEAMLQTDGGFRVSRCETECSFAYLQQGESSAWEDRWGGRGGIGDDELCVMKIIITINYICIYIFIYMFIYIYNMYKMIYIYKIIYIYNVYIYTPSVALRFQFVAEGHLTSEHDGTVVF